MPLVIGLTFFFFPLLFLFYCLQAKKSACSKEPQGSSGVTTCPQGKNKPHRTTHRFLAFEGAAYNEERYKPLALSRLFAVAAPCHQARQDLPFPAILRPPILQLPPQCKTVLPHFRWQWVCSTHLFCDAVDY